MSKQESARNSLSIGTLQNSSAAGQGKPTDVDLQRLAAMARHAYEQRHLKNCLAITKALLLVDSEHAEARALQSLIQSDIRQDLDNARTLLDDARHKGNHVQYEKAAQIVLSRVFNVDPANEEASALLSRIKTPLTEIMSAPAISSFKPIVVSETAVVVPLPLAPAAASATETSTEPAVLPETPLAGSPAPATLAPFRTEAHTSPTVLPEPSSDPWALAFSGASVETEAPVETERPPQTPIAFEDVRAGTEKRYRIRLAIPRSAIPIVLGVLAVIAGMLLRSRQPNVPAVQQSVKTAVSSTATRHVDDEFSKDVAAAPANDNYSEFTPASALPAAPKLPVAASAFIPRADISSVPITTPPSTTPPSAGVPPKPSPVPKRPATVVAAIKTGSLAVSSPTATDIYSGDKYLGSTPITLELSAGTHMLEYRHLDQRKSVTHVVKASEATTTMVTFEVTVQINARPWAQVFVEGGQRRSLGQTPLSNVQVPIGSVLIFENPNFPGKNYRITGKETAIQVVFP